VSDRREPGGGRSSKRQKDVIKILKQGPRDQFSSVLKQYLVKNKDNLGSGPQTNIRSGEDERPVQNTEESKAAMILLENHERSEGKTALGKEKRERKLARNAVGSIVRSSVDKVNPWGEETGRFTGEEGVESKMANSY